MEHIEAPMSSFPPIARAKRAVLKLGISHRCHRKEPPTGFCTLALEAKVRAGYNEQHKLESAPRIHHLLEHYILWQHILD